MLRPLRRSLGKRIAVLLLGSITIQLLYVPAALALTSGPSQPEFSSFEPVGVNDMVNKFTGEFTYRIPVLEVPGPEGSNYPLTLAYHSGANPEEDASWVGYGWSLNPGAINRNTRGFPDDFYGQEVKYWNKVPKNWTVTTGYNSNLELFSYDRLPLDISLSTSLRYNNNSGFGYNRGVGLSFGKGLISLQYSESDGQHSYSLSVNPMAALMQLATYDPSVKQNPGAQADKLPTVGQLATKNLKNLAQRALTSQGNLSLLGGNHGIWDYSNMVRPTQVSSYTGEAWNVSAGVEINGLPAPIGVTANLTGSYAYQQSLREDNLRAYGFMYSQDASLEKRSRTVNNKLIAGSDNIMSDYYTEKETPYSKRDVFLGIPFNNADNFSVSGDGIGGGFRLYHRQIGEFGPNSKRSVTRINNASVEIDIGGAFGAGLDRGIGEQSLEESSWNDNALWAFSRVDRTVAGGAAGNSEVAFRFNNDLGGNVGNIPASGTSDAPVRAMLDAEGKGYALNIEYSPLKDLMKPSPAAAEQRMTQGSTMSYHTQEEMRRTPLLRFSKRAAINEHLSGGALDPVSPKQFGNKSIGEFRAVNEVGNTYTYGLPVFSRNEKNLQYGTRGPGGTATLANNFLVYTANEEVKVGEERNGQYAASYLLTEVTTPDFVDRRMDGPDAGDFGGYTNFYYQKAHGHNKSSGWYHWRFPYNGLSYEKNSLSDKSDDVGSVAEGDKEIYFLQAIQTKSHTAIFSTSPREDGLDAFNEYAQNPQSSYARTNNQAQGSHALQKLDKIALYANSDVEIDPANQSLLRAKADAVPIKTVHLEYGYSLCGNTPNSTAGTDPASDASNPVTKGKLTLKKVWFDYNNIQNSLATVLTSPYIFQYAYPSYTTYPGRYQSFGTGFSQFTAKDQNPPYSRYAMDAWSNYQYNGAARYANMQSWPAQKLDTSPDPTTGATSFDPAAWQLKVITLPSGGQIHVQYEQHDYAYVQNKPAHALVPLDQNSGNSAGNSYYIDPLSIGVSIEQIPKAVQLLQSEYVLPQKKIFFKFLYSLIGTGTPQPNGCNVDYVSGYVKLRNAVAATNPATNKQCIRLDIGAANPNATNSYTLPDQVCLDFLKTQRLGKLNPANDCNDDSYELNDNESDKVKLVRQFALWITNLTLPTNKCAKLNPALSYFKIPLPISKKGGGIRVKRLLTYDKGFDGQPVLYGQEYSYKAFDPLVNDWRSSGVATNEPAGMRVESALVEHIYRGRQSDIDKVISGIDRKQSEGPLGESILPGPSIGYSRVMTRNIHSGRTNPGFSVTEFFTAKDYPIQVQMTALNAQEQFSKLYTGILNRIVNNVWATQGFSFVFNSMHGQQKREATYTGAYIADETTQLANAVLTAEHTYEYYEPGEKVNVIDTPGGLPTLQYVGREADLTVAQRSIKDITYDANIEADLQLAVYGIFPVIFPTLMPSLTTNRAEFYTHANSRVIRYPAILKKETSLQDGIQHVKEYLAFDRYTGSAVATRANDEHQGNFVSQDAKTAWIYPEKRGKYENEGAVLKVPSTETVTLARTADLEENVDGDFLTFSSAATACAYAKYLHKGDLVMLQQKRPSAQTSAFDSYLYMVGRSELANNRFRVYPTGFASAPAMVLNADVTVLSGPTPLMSRVDGNQPATIERIEILESGNSNELSAVANSFVRYLPRNNAVNIVSAAGANSTDNFTAALQAKLQLSGSPQQFTLPGPYVMDVSGYASKLPSACQGSAGSLNVYQMLFDVRQDRGVPRIRLLSFKVSCNNTLITVQ